MQKKILIVDDEVDFCTVVNKHLIREGYDTHIVYDGIKAIAATKAYQPDAILLDVKMAPKDGLEVLRELRAIPEYQNLPIILFSAVDQISSIQKGMACGATEFICKPAPSSAIIKTLKNYLAD